MAKYVVPGKYDQLVCPYDNTHVVDAFRMQGHLQKCRKQHPTMDFAVCPFNQTHMVPRDKLRHHQMNCPDKVRIEADLTHTYIAPPADRSMDITSTEDWEEEISSRNAILRTLNANREFKPILPRGHRAQGRSNKDIEGWLSGATHYAQLEQEGKCWQPDKLNNDAGAVLRQPRTAPKGLPLALGTRSKPSALALAGIGRGQPLILRQQPQIEKLNEPNVLSSSLPSSGPNSATSSLTSSPPRSSHTGAGGKGRGRGRGRASLNKAAEPVVGGRAGDNQNMGAPAVQYHAVGRGMTRGPLLSDALASSDGNSDAISNDDDTDNTARNIRKFKKKLNEIEQLKQQLKQGAQLNADQQRKLILEDIYKKKLKKLGVEL